MQDMWYVASTGPQPTGRETVMVNERFKIFRFSQVIQRSPASFILVICRIKIIGRDVICMYNLLHSSMVAYRKGKYCMIVHWEISFSFLYSSFLYNPSGFV